MEEECKDLPIWECPNNFIHFKKDDKGNTIAYQCWKKFFLDRYYIREFGRELLELKFKDIDKPKSKEELEFLKLLKSSYDSGKEVGYYLHGIAGLGKTYRTITYCNMMNKDKEKTISYIYVPTMINKMKQNFGKETNDNQLMIDKCKIADILVLDDIGSETTNKWWYTNVLLEILNTRAETNRPVIVVSNLTPKQLKQVMVKNMGLDSTESIMLDRILSRLAKCCGKTYSWNGNDRRANGFI